MIPILPLLRSRLAGYVIGAISVALLAGACKVHISHLASKVDRCRAEYAQLEAGYAQASQLRQEHALRLVEAARAEERAAWLGRYTQEQESAERLREAAREAQREASEWRQRLREAQAQDASCAAWIREAVRCPVK